MPKRKPTEASLADRVAKLEGAMTDLIALLSKEATTEAKKPTQKAKKSTKKAKKSDGKQWFCDYKKG